MMNTFPFLHESTFMNYNVSPFLWVLVEKLLPSIIHRPNHPRVKCIFVNSAVVTMLQDRWKFCQTRGVYQMGKGRRGVDGWLGKTVFLTENAVNRALKMWMK